MPLSAHAADRLDGHDRADFAQEFLRRNPAYRAAWRAMKAGSTRSGDGWEGEEKAAGWGLVRLFDPDRAVRGAPAIWRADWASQIVSLVPAGEDLEGSAMLPAAVPVAECVVGEVRHLVLDDAGIRHRLRVRGDPAAPLAILLPPRGDALRAAACDAARRLFLGQSSGAAAAILRPSVLQRRRLALLLRVLDASLADATTREIGTAIVYPWLGGMDALTWKTMSERRRVQRLVAEARMLAARGYRELLRA